MWLLEISTSLWGPLYNQGNIKLKKKKKKKVQRLINFCSSYIRAC